MRITLYFASQNDIIVPVHYNVFIQAMIYKYLKKDFATFLHEKGYEVNKRKFKLFCFSQLANYEKVKFDKASKTLNFGKKVEFTLSTAIDKIAIDVVENQMKSSDLYLERNQLTLDGIKVHTPKKFNDKVTLKMLSPLTVYSTLINRKKVYYSPEYVGFQPYLQKNLMRKLDAYSNNICKLEKSFIEEVENHEFSFCCVKKKKVITQFKKTIIEGYLGIYDFKAHPFLIELSYNAGLGTENSMGFGCWDLCWSIPQGV